MVDKMSGKLYTIRIMRLWHQRLIHHLPLRQLLGQHRECCALRGMGWGRKHSVVDYVFRYEIGRLYEYHNLVMFECCRRGIYVDTNWFLRTYRGKKLGVRSLTEVGTYVHHQGDIIYPEHDDRYLLECVLNLKRKGAQLVNGLTLEEIILELESRGVQS